MNAIVYVFFILLCLEESIQVAPVYKPGGATTAIYATEVRETGAPQKSSKPEKRGGNGLVTETVYGFLDFTTTVGSTVMVFTPQSETEKKNDLTAQFLPTSSPSIETSSTKSTFTKPSSTKKIPITESTKTTRTTEAATRTTTERTTSSNPPTGLAKLLQQARLGDDRKPKLQPSKELKPSPTTEERPPSVTKKYLSLNAIQPTNNELESKKTQINENTFSVEPTPQLPTTSSKIISSSSSEKSVVATTSKSKTPKAQTTKRLAMADKIAAILESSSKKAKQTSDTNFETVKEIIEGSATQFFKPDLNDISSQSRAPRYETESRFTRRRGSTPLPKDDYYYYYDYKDQAYNDDYEDLIRAGSGLRPSFTSTTSKVIVTPTSVFKRSQPSTYKPRFRPSSTRNIPPSFLRNQDKKRNRFQLASSRPKPKTNRRQPPSPPSVTRLQTKKQKNDNIQYPPAIKTKKSTEETIQVVTTTPTQGPSNILHEIFILRSLHTFRVGTTKSTRYVTYTKTSTHSIEPTSVLELAGSKNSAVYDEPPLFENILDDKKAEVATLPPINIKGKVLEDLLTITTETFRTTETLYKTSVLPVKKSLDVSHLTLTQTYLITRVVSAIKTIPPVELFEFVPKDSFNEFNAKLLAEGTENEAALLPGEKETNENREVRVPPPLEANLADLAGGKFNPEALEKQTNPDLVAALNSKVRGTSPELSGTKESQTPASNSATPTLSPEALQMAYLRLMNPYMFGGLGAQGQQTTVTSSPVVITTDVVTTSTQVIRVIFNARPIMKTISSTNTVRTTITTYSTATVTAQPTLPGLPFPFPAPLPFAAG